MGMGIGASIKHGNMLYPRTEAPSTETPKKRI